MVWINITLLRFKPVHFHGYNNKNVVKIEQSFLKEAIVTGSSLCKNPVFCRPVCPRHLHGHKKSLAQLTYETVLHLWIHPSTILTVFPVKGLRGAGVNLRCHWGTPYTCNLSNTDWICEPLKNSYLSFTTVLLQYTIKLYGIQRKERSIYSENCSQ